MIKQTSNTKHMEGNMSARVVSMQEVEAVLCLDEIEEQGVTVPATVVSRVQQEILCSKDEDMRHHSYSRWEKQHQAQAQARA